MVWAKTDNLYLSKFLRKKFHFSLCSFLRDKTSEFENDEETLDLLAWPSSYSLFSRIHLLNYHNDMIDRSTIEFNNNDDGWDHILKTKCKSISNFSWFLFYLPKYMINRFSIINILNHIDNIYLRLIQWRSLTKENVLKALQLTSSINLIQVGQCLKIFYQLIRFGHGKVISILMQGKSM